MNATNFTAVDNKNAPFVAQLNKALGVSTCPRCSFTAHTTLLLRSQ
jgi:hypothetical protein